jgi:hypothetical protein
MDAASCNAPILVHWLDAEGSQPGQALRTIVWHGPLQRKVAMEQSASFLQTAAERAASQQLTIRGIDATGSVLSDSASGRAVLVDVRSAAEWQFVGVVPGALRIELRTFPGMQPNPQFLAQLQGAVDKQALLLLMCRSGAFA